MVWAERITGLNGEKLKIYPEDKRIHYSLRLNEEKNHRIQLIEHIESLNRSYSTPISIIFSWRADMLKEFVDKLLEDREKPPLSWNLDEKFNFNIHDGMRILVAMKLASSMDNRLRISEVFDVLKRLSDEEISFWVWKILSLKNKALNSFKAMYL